jgi:large subunit ribosomal protein L25
MTTLEIQARDLADNEALRKAGFLPAVVYGKKTPSTPISVSKKDFIKVWKEAGESGVVELRGKSGNFDVLIHDVSYNPLSDQPEHIDFYAFEKGKKIEVEVPLEFIGVAPAVKDLGGNLMKVLRELKISADPQHIPHSIEVDISVLTTFESQILAEQIKLPLGVDLIEKSDEVVAAVSEPKTETEEPSAPVDLSAIEVEKKGKKEEESADGK